VFGTWNTFRDFLAVFSGPLRIILETSFLLTSWYLEEPWTCQVFTSKFGPSPSVMSSSPRSSRPLGIRQKVSVWASLSRVEVTRFSLNEIPNTILNYFWIFSWSVPLIFSCFEEKKKTKNCFIPTLLFLSEFFTLLWVAFAAMYCNSCYSSCLVPIYLCVKNHIKRSKN